MNPSALSTGLKWGLIYGLVSVIFGLIIYVLGQTSNFFIGLIGIVILIVFIILALRNHYQQSSKMTYGQGLLIGLLLGLIGGIFGAIFNYAIFTLDADLLKMTEQQAVEMSEKFMAWAGMDADQIDELIEQGEERGDYTISPIRQAISTFIASPIMSFLFTLIPAIFFRKKGSKY